MEPMLLTIGIPTYNRAASVARLLHQLLSDTEAAPVQVLVVDDGGEDGTYVSLSSDPAIATRVRLIRNDENLGYPRTLARVFEECKTEYLMVVADDDQVITKSLSPLLDYLERERPAFVSPQFLRSSTVYRGQENTGPIASGEFLASSAHASGLVYRVKDCQAPLVELAKRVDSKQADALVYPQVVVMVQLLIAGSKCEWLALPTVSEGSFEPSGIRDADGNAYWSLESRWQQLKAFDSLLSQYCESDTTGIAQDILNALYENVYSIIGSAMRSESPTLGAAFDRGARNAYSRTWPKVTNLPILRGLSRKA